MSYSVGVLYILDVRLKVVSVLRELCCVVVFFIVVIGMFLVLMDVCEKVVKIFFWRVLESFDCFVLIKGFV